jgi:putative selenium metabolism hydrolase
MTQPIDRDGLVRFAQDLVRVPSVLGGEERVVPLVAGRMRAVGFDRVETDEAGNVIGTLSGAATGPTLLYDAHMDTVDVLPREAWRHDPFGAELVEGRLYGRGSSDMKGALAAMIHAAGSLDRTTLAGQLVVSASVGEELVEGAALRAVMERCHPDYVVIGEASDLNLVRAGRGRAEFVVQTLGSPAHASSPDRGVNAVRRMCGVIAQIEALPMPAHPFVGRGVMCLTDVISVPYPAHSVVPSGCRATYERRLVPGETLETVRRELLDACARAGAADTTVDLARTGYRSYTGVEWDQPKWFPAWELGADHALVERALAGLRGIGLSPAIGAYQFCTNAAYSAGEAGVPTVGFGPSHEGMAHIVDEYLELEQLVAACRGYAAIATSVIGAR